MATSSIFENIKISDPGKAELFLEALEASEQDRENDTVCTDVTFSVADRDTVRHLQAIRHGH